MSSLDQLMNDVIDGTAYAESSGGKNRKNPLSGATGTYQFLPRTWEGLRKNYPELKLPPFEQMDDASEKRAIQALMQENANALQSAGLPVTQMTLYAAHHFGAPKAKVMLRQLAEGKNPKLKTILGSKVFEQNPKLSPDMTLKDWRNYLRERIGSGMSQAQQASQPTDPSTPAAPPPVKPDVGMEADRTRGPGQQAEVFSDAVTPAPAPGQQVAQAGAIPTQQEYTVGTDGNFYDAQGELADVDTKYTPKGNVAVDPNTGQVLGPIFTPTGGPYIEHEAEWEEAAEVEVAGDPNLPKGPAVRQSPHPENVPTAATAIPPPANPRTPAPSPQAEETKSFVPVNEVVNKSPNASFISINGKNFRRGASGGWSQVL